MRIALVCARYSPYVGGVETHVEEIGKRLAKRSFDVEVLTTDPSGALPKEEIIDNIVVRRFKSFAPGEAYFYSGSLRKYLINHSKEYSVIHGHSYHSFPALYAADAKKENRLVITPHYHGRGHTIFRNLLHIPWKYIANKMFARADNIVCVSDYERHLLASRFNITKSKLVTIPNGLNLKEFADQRKQVVKQKVILCVTRLEKYKGVESVIRVLPLLDKMYTLSVVGSGPELSNLRRVVSKLGLSDRVSFYHHLERGDLLQMYRNAVVFVSLSKHEAYGISIAEALASGVPCIVARTSALMNWIDDKSCFGVELSLDYSVLARKIEDISGTRVRYEGILDWEEVTDRLVSIYQSE